MRQMQPFLRRACDFFKIFFFNSVASSLFFSIPSAFLLLVVVVMVVVAFRLLFRVRLYNCVRACVRVCVCARARVRTCVCMYLCGWDGVGARERTCARVCPMRARRSIRTASPRFLFKPS